MKIILASFWTKAYEELAEITWIGKLHYAKKNGYGTYTENHEDGIDVMWDRPRKWASTLQRYAIGDWVLLTGCDVMVTRPDIKLESFIDPTCDIMCLVDHYFVFGDCLLVKNTHRLAELFLQIANRSHGQAPSWPNEQIALAALLGARPFDQVQRDVGTDYGSSEFYKRAESILNSSSFKVKLLNYPTKFVGDDPRVMYPSQVPYFHSWTKEHLLLHMGGKSLSYRLRVMPSYMPERGEPFEQPPCNGVAVPELAQIGRELSI